LQIMREEGVAGLVIAPAGEDPGTLAGAVHAGFPIVVVDRIMRDLEVDTVHSRNFDATVSAVAHLVKVGHQKIGFIGGPHRLSSARDRYSGFLCGLSDAGIAHRPDHAVFGNFRMESGRELVSDLLKLPDPPTAVLVANNEMVIGALNHIHSIGLNIPRDIAVVGFDDFPWSLNPPLTTIAQPVEEIGRTAARLLMERLAFPTRPCRTVTLEARLVVRSSCGAPMAQSAEFQSRSQHGSNANED
jgi:LacI family transcriptional regulator